MVSMVAHTAAGPAASPGASPAAGAKDIILYVAILVSTFASLMVVGLAAFGFCVWRMRQRNKTTNNQGIQGSPQQTVETELEYIGKPAGGEYKVFSFTILQTATNNFSDMNKLGRGGFGPVYKGILDGKEIAVKRLSECSVQGITEFKNEVDSLAELKHKNLVKFLGCCITNKEKLLCYEFLPNGSLDMILFGNTYMRVALCWELRYKIIKGISHGLHYLHEESPFKIIHRDLKPSNILLDKDMNPKISDFGLARFLGEEETHKATINNAGTFGYMAPEYFLCGNFSAKSDVYSFGILLLEILTGRKCSSFVGSDRISRLTDHAFKHWKNGTISQLKDQALEEDCVEEIKRCVHIALLCVQEDPKDRRTMAEVRTYLEVPSLTLPGLPFVWSPPEQLNFAILEETSTTRFHSVNNQAESSHYD